MTTRYKQVPYHPGLIEKRKRDLTKYRFAFSTDAPFGTNLSPIIDAATEWCRAKFGPNWTPVRNPNAAWIRSDIGAHIVFADENDAFEFKLMFG